MNVSFFIGGLAGIGVTIVAAFFVGWIFDLPRDGVDLDDAPQPDVPASEVVARFTGNVRLVPAPGEVVRSTGTGHPVGGVIPGNVVDLRDRADAPLDAGGAS